MRQQSIKSARPKHKKTHHDTPEEELHKIAIQEQEHHLLQEQIIKNTPKSLGKVNKLEREKSLNNEDKDPISKWSDEKIQYADFRSKIKKEIALGKRTGDNSFLDSLRKDSNEISPKEEHEIITESPLLIETHSVFNSNNLIKRSSMSELCRRCSFLKNEYVEKNDHDYSLKLSTKMKVLKSPQKFELRIEKAEDHRSENQSANLSLLAYQNKEALPYLSHSSKDKNENKKWSSEKLFTNQSAQIKKVMKLMNKSGRKSVLSPTNAPNEKPNKNRYIFKEQESNENLLVYKINWEPIRKSCEKTLISQENPNGNGRQNRIHSNLYSPKEELKKSFIIERKINKFFHNQEPKRMNERFSHSLERSLILSNNK